MGAGARWAGLIILRFSIVKRLRTGNCWGGGMGIEAGKLVWEDGADISMVIVRAVSRTEENVWLNWVVVSGVSEEPSENIMSFGM